ncbi:high affinity choline transporter 1-like [Engraulis encrasicolus]|uniref:high affinity choline transporter 1-like n=1 Tax=Engraulis encrasicolus TaxID=184585 RepID=UPI002FD10A9D
MALNVPGLIATMVFYAAVLATGIWSSRRAKAKATVGTFTEVALLGGRSIDLAVGIFTMTASWVGGGFILGLAEGVYSPDKGLVWVMYPVHYAVAFISGGLIFAKPMREKEYMTMMDPFERKYGKHVAALMVIPGIVAEILSMAGTLTALGGTISTILDVPYVYSVVISAAVAITYTLLGGLYSVAYTDVIQLVMMFVALWLCVPFILLNPIPEDISHTAFNQTLRPSWLGHIETQDISRWVDDFLAQSMGLLGFQCFHQRLLSASSPAKAQITCFAASVIVLFLGVPPVLIGAVAASTDWNLTSYGSPSPYERGESFGILPICLQHLTPPFLSIVGIAAVAAAVMSSVDSSLIASASMFSSNIYRHIRKQASDREMRWVIRVAIIMTGVLGMTITLFTQSLVHIWLLTADVAYCILLPQLLCAVFCPIANGYGAAVGFVLGVLLRFLRGEPELVLPAVLYLGGASVPVRTLSALLTLACVLLVSYASEQLFRHRILPERWNVLGVTGLTSSSPPATLEGGSGGGDAGGGEMAKMMMMSVSDKGCLDSEPEEKSTAF